MPMFDGFFCVVDINGGRHRTPPPRHPWSGGGAIIAFDNQPRRRDALDPRSQMPRDGLHHVTDQDLTQLAALQSQGALVLQRFSVLKKSQPRVRVESACGNPRVDSFPAGKNGKSMQHKQTMTNMMGTYIPRLIWNPLLILGVGR